jgi:hypothetical protein
MSRQFPANASQQPNKLAIFCHHPRHGPKISQGIRQRRHSLDFQCLFHDATTYPLDRAPPLYVLFREWSRIHQKVQRPSVVTRDANV